MKGRVKEVLGILAGASLLTPVLALAATFADFTASIVTFVNTYVINLLYAIAFVGFLYGVFKYFFLESADEHARSEGKVFILWGLIGIAVLFTVWGLVRLLLNTFSLGG